MDGKAIVLMLSFIATACSPNLQSGASPTPQVPTSSEPSKSTVPPTTSPPTVTSAPTTPNPSPTPIARTIRGQARLVANGVAVAGVRVRAMPVPINDGRSPGPEVIAVSGADGAYVLTVMVWTPDVLAASSSFQLAFDIVPPAGLLVVEVMRSMGAPPGTPAAGPFIIGDLDGPIDINLARGLIVEGRVTSGPAGTPLDGIRVTALGPNSIIINGGAGDAFEVQAGTATDATGRYKLTVPRGTYVIHVIGPQGVRFWTDDPSVFQPTPLRVEQDLAGIDIALVPVTPIGGQVRTGPSFGEGLEGVRVVAYLGGGSPCCRVVGVATSGYIGTFLLHLPPGRYRLAFEPPAGSPYATQWWNAAATSATATDLTLGQAQVRVEVELVRARP